MEDRKHRRPRGTGELRKIREGLYEGRTARVIDGDRIRKTFYGTRAEVIAQMDAWRVTPKRKRTASKIKVRDFLATWLRDVKAANRPATFRLREIIIRKHIEPYLGDVRIADLEKDHARGLNETLTEAGVGPSARRTAIATLICALNAAVADDVIPANPFANFKRPSVIKRKQIILTADESNRLIDAAIDDPYFPLYLLALRTGMRQG